MSRDRHACRSVDEQPQQSLKRPRQFRHHVVIVSHRVFLREPKLTSDSPYAHHDPALDRARVRTFVPQQSARKNYIGIVSDTTEEERVADSAAHVQPHVVGYLVGRLAAVLGRARKDAPVHTTTS